MTRRGTQFCFCLFASILLLSAPAFSQGAGGQSHVWYDDSSGKMVGFCETDLDYSSAIYYQAGVECYLEDGNGYLVDFNAGTDLGFIGEIDVPVEAVAVAGMQYKITGYHSVEMLHQASDVQDRWYDYYNFSSFPPILDEVPYFWFVGSGPTQIVTGGNNISIGPSTDKSKAPACPSFMSLGGTTAYSLGSYFPQYKTGMGIAASMKVWPNAVTWDGHQVTESLVLQSNSCPASVLTCDKLSGTFTIGGDGYTEWDVYLPAQRNIFYDQHATLGNYSMLQPANPISCSFSCKQTYSCGGKTVGTFTVTHTLHQSTIESSLVTNVSVTKQ